MSKRHWTNILLVLLLAAALWAGAEPRPAEARPQTQATASLSFTTITATSIRVALINYSCGSGCSASYRVQWGTTSGSYSNYPPYSSSRSAVAEDLTPSTTYYFKVTARYYEDDGYEYDYIYGQVTTLARNTRSFHVTAIGPDFASVRVVVDATATDQVRFGITPSGGATTYSYETIGGSGYKSVYKTHTSLTLNTSYTVTARIDGYAATERSVTFSTSEAVCSSTNSPAEDLGELALAAGSSISSSGQLAATVADASCVDADGRSSAYFELAIATGEAGAVKIEASPASSSLSPQLLVRSGQSTYTGTPLFQDVRSNTDALAAGHLAAGAYTVQLRAGITLAPEAAASGGAYQLTVTRLQPRLTHVESLATELKVEWDVGPPASSNTSNTIQLPVKIDYQEVDAATWTTVESSVSPAAGSRVAEASITGLVMGEYYLVRAAYTNASHYTESDGLLVRPPILLSGAPYGVEATAELLNEDTGRWRIRVSWETPPIEVDSSSNWRYATRLDQAGFVFNPSGSEKLQETLFSYITGGRMTFIEIEVANTISCTASSGSCEVTYNGRDYDIPAGEVWATPWSSPGLVNLTGSVAAAASEVVDQEPGQAVVEVIDAFLGVAGVPDEERPSRALSVALCAALGLFGGYTVVRRVGGMTLVPLVLGSGVFLTVFGGLGPLLFGVPAALVMVMIATPLALALVLTMRRFAS